MNHQQHILIGIGVAVVAAYFGLFGTKTESPLATYPETIEWGKSKPSLSIAPFNVSIGKQPIDDLKLRLSLWRRHEPLADVGYSYGFSGEPLDKLVKYWQEKYDWSKAESKLNSLPQFTTVIQGLKVHFVHAKANPKATKRIPLLLVHGWPGSVVEFYRAIPLLTELDSKHGTAFDVVAPSIPGYGFSEAPSKPGFNPIAAAQVFHALMKRLGYDKFIYQGGDWGSVIGALLNRIYPESVIGYHSNFVMPPASTLSEKLHLLAAIVAPNLFLDKNDVGKLDKLTMVKEWLEDTGYFHEQCTKPDTIGVALSDSPVGLAAWICEMFVKFTQNAQFKGDAVTGQHGISNDDLLTNVMVYWLTNHAASAARFYKETVQSMDALEKWAALPIMVPTAVACYPFEGLCSPKALLKQQMPRLVHYADIARGGHFAALEEPELFAQDLRAAVQAFYQFHEKEALKLAKKRYYKVEEPTAPDHQQTTKKQMTSAKPTTSQKASKTAQKQQKPADIMASKPATVEQKRTAPKPDTSVTSTSIKAQKPPSSTTPLQKATPTPAQQQKPPKPATVITITPEDPKRHSNSKPKQ